MHQVAPPGTKAASGKCLGLTDYQVRVWLFLPRSFLPQTYLIIPPHCVVCVLFSFTAFLRDCRLGSSMRCDICRAALQEAHGRLLYGTEPWVPEVCRAKSVAACLL